MTEKLKVQSILEENPDLHPTNPDDPEAGYQVWTPGDTAALASLLSPEEAESSQPSEGVQQEHDRPSLNESEILETLRMNGFREASEEDSTTTHQLRALISGADNPRETLSKMLDTRRGFDGLFTSSPDNNLRFAIKLKAECQADLMEALSADDKHRATELRMMAAVLDDMSAQYLGDVKRISGVDYAASIIAADR